MRTIAKYPRWKFGAPSSPIEHNTLTINRIESRVQLPPFSANCLSNFAQSLLNVVLTGFLHFGVYET
jgi:hypothetical protein